MPNFFGNDNQDHPSGVLVYGFDGTNAKAILVDASKRQVVSVTNDTGDFTTATHSKFTTVAASGTALAANTARLYAAFQNDSDSVIYLALGAAAVASSTLPRINANGGSYEMSKKLGNLFTGAVNAICASIAKVLLVVEGT